MKRFSKIVALLLVFCMVFSLTACGKKEEAKTVFQVMKEANEIEAFTLDMEMNMTEETLGDMVITAEGTFSVAEKAANLTMEMVMGEDTINIGNIMLIEDTLYWDFASLLEYMEITPDDLGSLLAMMEVDTTNFESFSCVSIKLFDVFANRDAALELSNLFIDTYEKAVKKTDEKMISLADGVYTMTLDTEDSTALVTNLVAAIEEDIEPLYDALAEYVATLDLSFVEGLVTPILEMTGESLEGIDFSELNAMTSELKDNKEEYLPQVKELLTEAITEMNTALEGATGTEDAAMEQTIKVSLTGEEGSRVFTTESNVTETLPDLGEVTANTVVTITETTEPVSVTTKPVSTDIMDVISVLYNLGTMEDTGSGDEEITDENYTPEYMTPTDTVDGILSFYDAWSDTYVDIMLPEGYTNDPEYKDDTYTFLDLESGYYVMLCLSSGAMEYQSEYVNSTYGTDFAPDNLPYVTVNDFTVYYMHFVDPADDTNCLYAFLDLGDDLTLELDIEYFYPDEFDALTGGDIEAYLTNFYSGVSVR